MLVFKKSQIIIVNNYDVSIHIFFDYTVQLRQTHARTLTPLWTHVRKPYPYEYLRRLSRQIIEIDEVITGASLSTGTSPTT